MCLETSEINMPICVWWISFVTQKNQLSISKQTHKMCGQDIPNAREIIILNNVNLTKDETSKAFLGVELKFVDWIKYQK